MCFKLLVVIAIITTYQDYLATAEQCGQDRFMDLSLVKFRGARIGSNREGTRMDNEIRIINSIQFTCPTQIASIILGIDVREPTRNRNMYPSLQLWRPIASNGRDGRVGFELVPHCERPIIYIPANVSSTGIHEYPLIPPLDAISGDYLAISQPDTAASVVRVYTVDGGSGSSYQISLGVTVAGLVTEAMNELVLIYPITSNYLCVNSTVNSTLVMDQALLSTSETRFVNYQTQFLYPAIKFTCNGTIHKWIYSGITRASGTKLPELQIWRQTSDGNYIKRGSSKVSANRVYVLSLNVYELIVDPPIKFMEGDIFGQYQPKEEDSAFVLCEQRFSGPTNLRATGTFDEPLDIISTDELEVASNDYPLVTLEISMIANQAVMSLTLSSLSPGLHSVATMLSPTTPVQGSSTTCSITHNTVSSYGVVTSIHTADSLASQASSLVETSIHSTSNHSRTERVSVTVVVVPVVAGVVVVIAAIVIAVFTIIGIWRIMLKHSNNRNRGIQAPTTNDYELDPCYTGHHYMISSGGAQADDNIYKEI